MRDFEENIVVGSPELVTSGLEWGTHVFSVRGILYVTCVPRMISVML